MAAIGQSVSAAPDDIIWGGARHVNRRPVVKRAANAHVETQLLPCAHFPLRQVILLQDQRFQRCGSSENSAIRISPEHVLGGGHPNHYEEPRKFQSMCARRRRGDAPLRVISHLLRSVDLGFQEAGYTFEYERTREDRDRRNQVAEGGAK